MKFLYDIFAIAKKDWLQESRWGIWFYLSKLWPVLWIIVFALAIGEKSVGIAQTEISYVSFLVIGVLANELVVMIMWTLGNANKWSEGPALNYLFVAPVSKKAIIGGKLLLSYIDGSIRVFLILFLAVFVMHINFNVSPWFFLIFLLGTLAYAAIGVLILSAFLKRRGLADQVSYFIEMIMVILAGVYFPITILPNWIQTIAGFIPLTHMANGLRKTLLIGGGFEEILPEIIALSLFVIVLLPLAYFIFKRALANYIPERY